MAKGGSAAPRFLGPVMTLVALGVLGLIVLGVMKVGSAVKHDWKTVSDLRAGDAAQVTAEREAGKAYLDKLALSLSAAVTGTTDEGASVMLTGKISNTGASDVIRAVAKVRFLPEQGDEPLESRDVILFDASELSMTTDRPLSGGETRDLSMILRGVSSDWTSTRISYEVSEARVRVPGE